MTTQRDISNSGHNRACEEIEQMILESSRISSDNIWWDCRNTATYYRKPITAKVLRRINKRRGKKPICSFSSRRTNKALKRTYSFMYALTQKK